MFVSKCIFFNSRQCNANVTRWNNEILFAELFHSLFSLDDELNVTQSAMIYFNVMSFMCYVSGFALLDTPCFFHWFLDILALVSCVYGWSRRCWHFHRPHSSYIQKPLTIRVKIPRLFSPIHEQKLLKSFSNASPTIIFHFEPPWGP